MDSSFPLPNAPHPHGGHEESDLSPRGIIMSGVFLFIGGVVAFALMYGFYAGLEKYVKGNQPALSKVEGQLQVQRKGPAAVTPADNEDQIRAQIEERLKLTFPTPRLQYDDEDDMKSFATSEEDWLSSTGKLPDGSVHIPIDRAMDLVVKNGLPPVSGNWQPPTLPTAVPMVPAGGPGARR